MVKSLPCNVGDMGLTLGHGTRIPHATRQLTLDAAKHKQIDVYKKEYIPEFSLIHYPSLLFFKGKQPERISPVLHMR